MNPLTTFEQLLIKRFIDEHWSRFVQHCEELGILADEAEAIVKKLEGNQ